MTAISHLLSKVSNSFLMIAWPSQNADGTLNFAHFTAKVVEHELLTLTDELRRQYPKEIWDNEYIHSNPGRHCK